SEWTVRHPAEEVMNTLQAAGVPAGVVQNAEDIVDKDPQLRHWEMLPIREHPELGAALHAGWPVHFSDGLVDVRAAPCLGEHTEYVCRELLGMSDGEFMEFINSGASE
ncbi:MAG: CoA transferase, partial [Chloroflexota bacterium]